MAGRKERLARALEKGGLALNDMHDRLAGIESTQGEILALLRTLHGEFGAHRDHAMETINAQGRRLAETRKQVAELVEWREATEGPAE